MPFVIEGASRQALERRAGEIRNTISANTGRVETIELEAVRQGRTVNDAEIARQEHLLAASQRLIEELDTINAALPQARSDDPLDQPQPRRTPTNAADPIEPTLGTPGASRLISARIPPMVDMAQPVARASYATLFGAAQPAHGEESFTRFLNAVASRDTSYLMSRPRNAGAATYPGEAGGFAVPAAVSGDLLEQVVEQSQFLRYCRVVPMTAKSQSYPILNIRDRSKGPAKLEAKKVAEGAAANVQTPVIEEVTLNAHKAITFWTCTREMLDDSLPGTDRALIRAAGGAIAMQLDREIMSGTGVNQLLGVTTSPATVVASKDGGQTAATLSFSNLTAMLARLLPSAYKSAFWLVSQTTLPQLFAVYHPVMNSSNVVGGLPAPLTQGADGTYRLFGLPLVVSDFAQAIGERGDISLFDLSWYLIGFREQLRVELSTERYFEEDRVAFRVVQRRDGLPILPGPITPAVGSTTISPFVQLEAR